MTEFSLFSIGMPLGLIALSSVQLSRAYKAAPTKLDPKVAYFVAVGTFFCLWFSGAGQVAALEVKPQDYELYTFTIGPVLFTTGLIMVYIHELSWLAGTLFMFFVGTPLLMLGRLLKSGICRLLGTKSAGKRGATK